MRWMVIYEYEVPGGALNLNSTKLPRLWSPWGSSPSRKNPHGTTGNRTRDIMISNNKLQPLDHEAGLKKKKESYFKEKRAENEILNNFFKNILDEFGMNSNVLIPHRGYIHANLLSDFHIDEDS
jgi:hypothetical protein